MPPDLIERILLGCRRLVLIAPPQPPSLVLGTVMVWWEEAAEAARAIAAAMPLRVNAKQVLLAALKNAIRRWAMDWPIFLASWFGTEAAPKSIFMPSVAGPVGEVLMAAARAHHADMLVMGAYGHGRMRKSSSAALPSQSLNRLKLRSF